MYLNTTALIRPELSSVVEEAAFADSYFIGLQVFPVYNSERDTGEYYKITRATSELQKKNITERAAKGEYGKVDRTFEKDSFSCKDRGIEEELDDTVLAKMNNFFDVEATTAKLLTRAIMLDHEQRVSDAVMNTGNFDATAAAVAYTEANLATINFVLDAQNASKLLKKRGEMPNSAIMNRDVFDRVRRSGLLASYLFGPLGGGQQVTEDMIAKVMGVQKLYVADAAIDTSKKGQTAASTYIWPATYIWMGNIAGGEFTAGGAGRTIVYTGDASSVFLTETYRKESNRTDVIRVRQHTSEKVISAPSGTLITTSFA